MRKRPPVTGDDAFTLVEILIGMAILGIIVGAIGGALIVGLSTTDATNQRLSESHDAQIASSYLANDVQSAAAISVGGGGGDCGAATQLVSFTYAGSGKVANYACGPSGGETRVTRTFAGSTVVLAHFAANAAPTVTCTGCGTSSPVSVAMRFTEASGYSYTLVGSQRTTAPGSSGGGGGTQDITLFVLGGGGSSPLWVSGSCPPGQIADEQHPERECSADSESSAGGQPATPKLTVLGNLYVNAPVNGAVRLSGLKNAVKLSVQGGDFKILSGGTCSGCTPQTVVCPSCTTTPPPGSYSPALLDPLRFMTAPDETGLPVYSDGAYHGPGVYTTQLNVNSSRTFASGTYVLNNGMNVTGNAVLTGSGVVFYNKGGNISLAGTTTFSVTPPTSGQYRNVVIFQSRTNNSAVTLAGGSGNSPIGIIYVPQSTQVTLGTGSAQLRVSAVIAQSIKVSGSSQVTIG